MDLKHVTITFRDAFSGAKKVKQVTRSIVTIERKFSAKSYRDTSSFY